MIFSCYYGKRGLKRFCCERGLRLVRVSLSAPAEFSEIDRAVEVYPTWEMVRLVKEKGDYRGYKRLYWEQVLRNVNIGRFVERFDNSVLLCYESDYKCCHRYLLGQWLLSEGLGFGGELSF